MYTEVTCLTGFVYHVCVSTKQVENLNRYSYSVLSTVLMLQTFAHLRIHFLAFHKCRAIQEYSLQLLHFSPRLHSVTVPHI